MSTPQQAVVHQLLAGELPLTLAYWFSNIKSCQTLAKPARGALSAGLIELLDGEGMPHARYVPHWRSLLACWTRSVALGRSVPKGGLTDDARLQYEWLVRQTIRWRRPDGNLMFEDPLASPAAVDDLLSAALRLGGDRADHELWDCSRGRKKAERSRYKLPRPGEHSEWAETVGDAHRLGPRCRLPGRDLRRRPTRDRAWIRLRLVLVRSRRARGSRGGRAAVVRFGVARTLLVLG